MTDNDPQLVQRLAKAEREAFISTMKLQASRIAELESGFHLIASSKHFQEGDYGYQFVIIARQLLAREAGGRDE